MRMLRPGDGRRSGDKPFLERLPRWLLISIVGFLLTATVTMGSFLLAGEAKWREQLQLAIADSARESQQRMGERIATLDEQMRAQQAADEKRDKADEKRDVVIDKLVAVTSKLTVQLDILTAQNREKRQRGE